MVKFQGQPDQFSAGFKKGFWMHSMRLSHARTMDSVIFEWTRLFSMASNALHTPRRLRVPGAVRIRYMALAMASLLAGCANPVPSSAVRSAVPFGGLATVVSDQAPGADPLSQWWQRFNDPLLTALVTQALQANTSVRAAQAALQQSRALRDVRQASMLPGATASTSAQRNQTDSGSASSSFRIGLDASWEPDVFGGRNAALSATESDAQAAQASLGDVRVSVAAEVALAYIQLRGLQSQWQIARNNLASQQETLQLTTWRAQAGLASSLEVEQARAASEQTAAQIPSLQSGQDKTRHSLAVLTGQSPITLNTPLEAVVAIPQAADDLALNIPANTLRQRPDVRAAEHRMEAALARVAVADAAQYPNFSIGGSVGLNALTLSGLAQGAGTVSALLASISMPLFDGGATRSQRLAQEAALEQARASYQAAVLTALKDVQDALVTLRHDRDRRAHLRDAAIAASNAALLAQQRYSSGLIDFQTVLQTQRNLLTAQDAAASSSADISADHVRLYKALGGGWN